MKTLRDKVVVITGAGSGIGRALALRCAQEGARLALSDVNVEGLAETVREVERLGAKTVSRRLDVSDRLAFEAHAEEVRASLGPADVLVANAGVSLSQTIERMELADFEWVMNVNFWGVVYGVSAFLPQLLSRPEAHIATLSSVFGLIGVPAQAAYNASKFAVRGYTETLRQELFESNVRVTCVHPGGVRTNIVRYGKHYTSSVDHGETDVSTEAERFEQVARTTPERAAQDILDGILAQRPRVLIGMDARIIDALQRLLPAHYDAVTRTFMRLASGSKKHARGAKTHAH